MRLRKVYAELWVISIVTVRGQVHVPGLGLVLAVQYGVWVR